MATPLFHSAVAISVARVVSPRKLSWPVCLVFLLAANLADIDILAGAICGELLKYHHFLTHSLAFALAAGVFLSLALWKGCVSCRSISYRHWLGGLVFVCISHPLLDLITYDSFNQFPGASYGLELGWPLSVRLIGPVLRVLPGPLFTPDWRTWFIAENLKIFALEGIAGAGLVAFTTGLKWPLEGLPYPKANV